MTIRRLLAALSILALAACAAQKAAPPPAQPLPRRVATPAPAPPPPPLPPAGPLAWMDLPATPGEWSYRVSAEGSQALFGPPASEALMILACNRVARRVELVAHVDTARPAAMRVLTQFTNRLLETRARGDGQPLLTATLAATDPLLDSMAFSRGRFAVEIEGAPTLYLPAWPEVGRVIEDCR